MQLLLSLFSPPRLESRLPVVPRLRSPAQPADSGSTAQIAGRASAAIIRKNDDRLSSAETGLLLAAFSTLLCSIMFGVIVP